MTQFYQNEFRYHDSSLDKARLHDICNPAVDDDAGIQNLRRHLTMTGGLVFSGGFSAFRDGHLPESHHNVFRLFSRDIHAGVTKKYVDQN